MTAVQQRLTSTGPKRVLALDGGGVRGIVTLGFLQRLEDILRQRHGGDPAFRLCDYFDLIGGSSTGSIIGTCLSMGMLVSDIRNMYLKLGNEIFGAKQSLFSRYTGAKFSPSALRNALNELFRDLTLGSDVIKTGLCIVMKRTDSGSTWPLLNHPNGVYFEKNKGVLLRTAIRASTAAPTYFTPEKLEVGHGEEGVFVDGGVSMYNNPALLLFLIATLEGYAFKWPTGAENLLIVSLGTGSGFVRNSVRSIINNRVWNWGKQIPDLLMKDASIQSHLMLQYMSDSPTRTHIDAEIGNMKKDLLGGKPLLSYLRYSVDLETNELNTLGFTGLNLTSLTEMSNAKNIKILEKIGEKAAQIKMMESHLPKEFDIIINSD